MRAPFVTFLVLAALSTGTGVAASEAGSPPAEGPPRGAVFPAPDARYAPGGPVDPSGPAGSWWVLAGGGQAVPVGGALLTRPAWDVDQQEASGGTRLSVLGGVGGFVLGAAVGGALGCAANRDDYGVFCGGQDDTKVYVGAAIGAVAGAALGAYLFRGNR